LEKITMKNFTQKIIRIRKIDTAGMREKALNKLESLAEEAQSYAMDKNRDEKERRDWARIAGYIYQTLNSVVSEYDLAKINEKLEELRSFVKSRIGKTSQAT